MGERPGCSNKGEDCLHRERVVQRFFEIWEAVRERERERIWRSERRSVKTLIGINVLAAHA